MPNCFCCCKTVRDSYSCSPEMDQMLLQSSQKHLWEKLLPDRHRLHEEEPRQLLLNDVDKNLSAVFIKVIEGWMQNFVDLDVSRHTVYNFMMSQCNLSIQQAPFLPVERNSDEKIQQRYRLGPKVAAHWRGLCDTLRPSWCISPFMFVWDDVWLEQRKRLLQ